MTKETNPDHLTPLLERLMECEGGDREELRKDILLAIDPLYRNSSPKKDQG